MLFTDARLRAKARCRLAPARRVDNFNELSLSSLGTVTVDATLVGSLCSSVAVSFEKMTCCSAFVRSFEEGFATELAP